jgi:IS5 family transposase
MYQKKKYQRKKNRKEGHNLDSRKGKKDGGRKEGRQKARNNGLAPRCCVHLPIYTCYFQTAASSAQFTSVGFTMW